MTWTMLGDNFADRPDLLDVSRSARLLHIEALVYCNRLLTDGNLHRRHLRRITDTDDPEIEAAELVAAGLWVETPTGWQVDWSEQETAETVLRRKAQADDRQRRHRAHTRGDHSLCTPGRCRYATRDTTRDETSHATRDTTRESRRPYPSPPNPTPDVVRGVGVGPASADAPPTPPDGRTPDLPPARRLPPQHPRSNGCCPLPPAHPVHQAAS